LPPPEEPVSEEPGHKGRRHRRRAATSERRRRRRRVVVPLVVLALLVLGAGAFVGVRLSAAAPIPAVTGVLPRSLSLVPAKIVPLPFPTTGQGAVSIPSIGAEEVSGPEQPVPVASLTKLMTAYVVLRDHPLVPGAPGRA
jgi:D-alanyl-D-alanine carboxypeptidase (penicillin-binding protein 5/6)